MPPKDAPREAVIELQLDVPNLRYWSRTVEGQGAGGEIFTRLTPVDEQTTDIVVEFRVPLTHAKQGDALGKAYLRLYQRLWDEDEQMMRRRQELIDSGKITAEPKMRKSVKRQS
jgi:hypothetical protein